MKEEIPFHLSLFFLSLCLSVTITKIRFVLKCQQSVYASEEWKESFSDLKTFHPDLRFIQHPLCTYLQLTCAQCWKLNNIYFFSFNELLESKGLYFFITFLKVYPENCYSLQIRDMSKNSNVPATNSLAFFRLAGCQISFPSDVS